MKKKLYYTVEVEIEDGEFVTGNKTICVYDIIDNVPKEIVQFQCSNEEDSKAAILDNLDSEKYPEVDLYLL